MAAELHSPALPRPALRRRRQRPRLRAEGAATLPWLAAPLRLRLSFPPRRTSPSLPQDPPAAAAAAGRPEGQPGRPAAERGARGSRPFTAARGPAGRLELGLLHGTLRPHGLGPRSAPSAWARSPASRWALPKHLRPLWAPGRAERRERHTGTRERRPWQRTREKGGKGSEPLKAQWNTSLQRY